MLVILENNKILHLPNFVNMRIWKRALPSCDQNAATKEPSDKIVSKSYASCTSLIYILQRNIEFFKQYPLTFIKQHGFILLFAPVIALKRSRIKKYGKASLSKIITNKIIK